MKKNTQLVVMISFGLALLAYFVMLVTGGQVADSTILDLNFKKAEIEMQIKEVKPKCLLLDQLREERKELENEINNAINKGLEAHASSPSMDLFLQEYGAEFVKEAGDIFREVGMEYGIKPEVLVAIAHADSSLGKHLKSSYNIGNVGNNDRGNVVHYASLEQGIEAMGKVLNNKYLGHYTTIGQLSRGGGNHSGAIYASSPYNWNKNVLWALSKMLGYQVDTNFNFRF